jgi:hypothetical protein
MLPMLLIRIGLVVAMALAVSGCGADKKAAATGGAEIVSANAPVFLAIDSDLSSDQWRQVDELLRKFPGRSQLISEIRSSLEEDGLDYERDVKPALGDEVDLVWLDFADGGSNVVVITKPKNAAAFRRMIEKGNVTGSDQVVYEEMDGWWILSETRQTIDRFRQEAESGERLADSDVFRDALGELPDDALVKVYARGESLLSAFRQLAQGAGAVFQLQPDQRPEFLAAALVAQDNGLRLVGVARAEQEPKAKAESFESALVDDVPGDAIAFLTFRGGRAFEGQLSQLKKNPTYREGLREFERMLGFPVDRVLAFFKNEVAFYVRPGTPIPEFALLLEAPNEQAVLRDINTIINKLTSTVPAQPCHVPAECTDFSGVEISRAAFDGKVVITTQWMGIEEVREGDSKLPDAKSFKEALEAAGVPDENPGYLWVDVKRVLPMILGFATLAGEDLPQELRANLAPLKSFVVWGDVDGRTSTFSAFLGID